MNFRSLSNEGGAKPPVLLGLALPVLGMGMGLSLLHRALPQPSFAVESPAVDARRADRREDSYVDKALAIRLPKDGRLLSSVIGHQVPDVDPLGPGRRRLRWIHFADGGIKDLIFEYREESGQLKALNGPACRLLFGRGPCPR